MHNSISFRTVFKSYIKLYKIIINSELPSEIKNHCLNELLDDLAELFTNYYWESNIDSLISFYEEYIKVVDDILSVEYFAMNNMEEGTKEAFEALEKYILIKHYSGSKIIENDVERIINEGFIEKKIHKIYSSILSNINYECNISKKDQEINISKIKTKFMYKIKNPIKLMVKVFSKLKSEKYEIKEEFYFEFLELWEEIRGPIIY